MYMHQESNTQLTRTREKPFTQASVVTIRPPGRYKPIKLMKYDRLGGFTCALFLFWESQCGGELGQLFHGVTSAISRSLPIRNQELHRLPPPRPGERLREAQLPSPLVGKGHVPRCSPWVAVDSESSCMGFTHLGPAEGGTGVCPTVRKRSIKCLSTFK